MAFNYPDPSDGDNWKTWIIGFVSAVRNFLSAIPGDAIGDGEVGLAKIAKQKAVFTKTLVYQGNLSAGAASIAGQWGGKIPQADGSISTAWKLVSYSIYTRGSTPRTGNELVVKKGTTYAGSVAVQTISLATLAAQTPVQANLTSETAFTTDDMWFVDYTYSAAAGVPVYTDVTLELYWEQNHVGA